MQKRLVMEKKINIKLDKITKMLDLLLEKMEKDEPALDKKLVKKIAKEWKEIEKGKVKIYHYNSLKDFEKAIS